MSRCPRHDWFETGALGWGRDPGRPVLRCVNCKKKRGMTTHEYELWGQNSAWKVMGAIPELQTEGELRFVAGLEASLLQGSGTDEPRGILDSIEGDNDDDSNSTL